MSSYRSNAKIGCLYLADDVALESMGHCHCCCVGAAAVVVAYLGAYEPQPAISRMSRERCLS